jgi:putative membrane protein
MFPGTAALGSRTSPGLREAPLAFAPRRVISVRWPGAKLPRMITLIRLAAIAATLLLLATVLPGIRIKSKKTAVIVAVVFSVLNVFLGWLVAWILVLPALLTLGLLFLVFPLIINTVMLWLTDVFIDDFEITDTKTLLITSVAITFANGVVVAAMR